MKGKIALIVLTAFGVFSFICIDAYGQKKIVDFREFGELRSKGLRAVYDGPRRTESSTEVYQNGNLVKSDHYLSEFISGDRHRFVSRRMENNKTIEHESIIIGTYQYSRVDRGSWTKIELPPRGSGSGSGTGTSSCSVRQLTVEPTFLGSYSARLFEALEVTSGKDGLVLEETRTWIGDDGALLQEEIVNSSFEPRVVNTKKWARYEMNPNLKIEAPIE